MRRPTRATTRCHHITVAVLVLIGLFAASLAAQEKQTGVGTRMFVIGASASSGFLMNEPFGGERTPSYRLKYYLDAALSAPHEPVRSTATAMFFTSAEPIARSQIAAAVAAKPTLTVSVDFLFWFCYGRLQNQEQRLELLEKGLALLQQLPGTVVVGDLPDASSAIGKILDREEVPSPETLSAANRRIRQWATTRPSVVVLPLSDFMATCKANKAMKLGPAECAAGKTREFLQADELHPSQHGAAALALSVFGALSERGLISQQTVVWDTEAVRARAVTKSEPERSAAKKTSAGPVKTKN